MQHTTTSILISVEDAEHYRGILQAARWAEKLHPELGRVFVGEARQNKAAIYCDHSWMFFHLGGELMIQRFPALARDKGYQRDYLAENHIKHLRMERGMTNFPDIDPWTQKIAQP